jgi:tRNA threonylcarbamoyl adenosine modification protein (Sua5/YciO/YrdC/YwlC family)
MTQPLSTEERAINVLREDGLVALPTPTVYGVAALATSTAAIDGLLAAKKRPRGNPLAVCILSPDHAHKYADISPLAQKLMDVFWPGPLTLVLPARADHGLSPRTISPFGTIGLRCPKSSWVEAFKACGFDDPLVLTSANISGETPPTRAEDIAESLRGKLGAVLDEGPSKIGTASTVISVDQDRIQILRTGAISEEILQKQVMRTNTEQCVTTLKAAFPAKLWSQNPQTLAPYLAEWRGRWQGETPLLLLPRTTQDVSDMVRICAQHRVPITTQGGNTGLVGGQIPQGEILLSTKHLTQVRNVGIAAHSMVCEAGMTLAAVQEAADTAGLKFPLSLASEGSCTIGGNLSTNAGGVHVVKYGNAKDLCFGVEAVLADGSVYNGLSDLRKDNTGYDLSRLLMGAEGTLGIITAACLKLSPKPAFTHRVMVGIASPARALTLLTTARSGNYLAMFELISRLGMDYVTQHIPNQKDPFADIHPWYVLIEWEFEREEHGQQWAEKLLETALSKEIIEDAVIATSQAQSSALLSLRENLSASQKAIGATIKHDISVPIADVPAFIERANIAVQETVPHCRPLAFGHMGDGNIHYNIGQPEGANSEQFMQKETAINRIVYDIVDELGGSFSAEHGIGILKKDELLARADPVKLKLLRDIKQALDPDNILNPRIMI